MQLAWALISYQLGSHHLEEYSRVWHTDFRQALAQFRTLGNGYDEADTLARIAGSHRALNRPDEARAARARALVLYREQEREAEISHAEEALGGRARRA
ncbi:hypothetical protein AB0P36_29785 [Streptomyces flavidovirens]|uniref:hypothetical protein n=1 Tax=Streptomyces flavidovirens TaxID=67298 RepID=UPI0034353C43